MTTTASATSATSATGHTTAGPSPDAASTGQTDRPRPRGRRGGEAATSPRRVRAQLRATLAVYLRAGGMTFAEIADHPDEEGRPLYPNRKRAHEAVVAQLGRGALAAHRLADAVAVGGAVEMLDEHGRGPALSAAELARAREVLVMLVAAAQGRRVEVSDRGHAFLRGALDVVDEITRQAEAEEEPAA